MVTDRDDAAERLASSLSRIPGVASVQICGHDASVLGLSPGCEPEREASLAAFIGRRAESLGDGDLRGWGARLVSGQLDRIVLDGARRETLILREAEQYIWLSLAPGSSADTVEPTVRLMLQRFR